MIKYTLHSFCISNQLGDNLKIINSFENKNVTLSTPNSAVFLIFHRIYFKHRNREIRPNILYN